MSKCANVCGKKCQVTGKKAVRGNSYAIRGIAKKKKGIGLKVTGISRRSFKPNVRKKRFWHPIEKRYVTLKISAAGMRTVEKQGVVNIARDLKKVGVRV